MYEIILASGSPRRSELLKEHNIEFKVVTSEVDETVEDGLEPYFIVEQLSLLKAAAVCARLAKRHILVIGADTVVAFDGEILTKPTDEADARRMLKMLSKSTHSVYTGITVIRGSDAKAVSVYEETRVSFRELCDREIDEYIKTGEPMDKAGAYGIQGLGGRFVEAVSGDFENVVGLPVTRLQKLISEEFDCMI